MEKESHAYFSFLKILNEHGFNELAVIDVFIGLIRAGGISISIYKFSSSMFFYRIIPKTQFKTSKIIATKKIISHIF